MKAETCAALLAINRRFYAHFAADFARTRQSWPAGFERILPHLRSAANVADLGCGNGRLLGFLAERGWRGRYLGVDNSEELLAIAAANAPRDPLIRSEFRRAELVALDPATPLALADALGPHAWEAVVALAVLHHIPGKAHRIRFLAACADLLRPGGVLVVSTWQFLTTPRLRARILPWEAAGIRPEEVEPDDYLLAWGERAAGQRYCAAIGEAALSELAVAAGLSWETGFYADGHEGNLNLYGIFRSNAST
ncbi:MAG: class I SAM-dependent methyltransferase [Anaerolineae bacterium]|nr:class I SAM-dependent methyltransferase [Anaerolineae bacterium]